MSKAPEKVIRLGLMKASIWRNNTKQRGDYFRVSLARLYKDGPTWKESTRFDRDDLLTLAKVCDQANSWIHSQQQIAKTERAPSS